MEAKQSRFLEILLTAEESKGQNSRLIHREDLDRKIQRLSDLALETEGQKTSRRPGDSNLLKRFDLAVYDDTSFLLKKGTDKRIVCAEETYEIINSAHIATGHGGRDITLKHLLEKFSNISATQISAFISLCEECQLKRTRPKKSIVVKPILSNELNSRCQVHNDTQLYFDAFLLVIF